jgi:beta-N-acetylhexosaminidase
MRRFLSVLSLFLVLTLQGSHLSWPGQQTTVDAEVEAILAQMGPEERVGQLFLVTFYGSDYGSDSEIARLISEYRVGGVVLLAENGNFSGEGDDLPEQIYRLTSELQRLAGGLQSEEIAGEPDSSANEGVYIPLFIGVEQGEGYPYDYLPSVMSPLPTSMAIGATWDPTLAQEAGRVAGQELTALGFNLLLGPSADVVQVPQPYTAGDMGTRVFGGEPFWVSQMTAAYVRGVHEGSEGRVAVVPRYFPGYGGADRLASVEIPTVRRSLDQLIQFDLKPFFAVTGGATDPLERAEGLMTGHIRYLGFQGDNPRLSTRPISLDQQALQVLLRLDRINSWRQSGGLLISDALGLRGVRRFYDPQEMSFSNRRVAQDAFLAGNDILYLGNFGGSSSTDQTARIIDTIEFFVQLYNTDPAFQARVDESVRRIIQAKLNLYQRFELDRVLSQTVALDAVGQNTQVALNVAQRALTLLSPEQAELLSAPRSGEHIVVFTDSRVVQQCPTCTARPLLAVDALQSAILRLYGPQASDLVSLANIQSFSFDQLSNYLQYGPQEVISGEGTPQPDALAIALNSADWIVFVMLNVDTNAVPSSDVVKRFLAYSPVGTDTQIVVMAMGAPYYLDSTEIGKLAAYYALYDYSEPFIDVAARALFLGVPESGASPVSVSGIGYDIFEVTSPDPDQIINLSVVNATEEAEEGTATLATPPVLEQGDTLFLTTSIILDQNAHPVPDGTPVEFIVEYLNTGLRDTLSAVTMGGVARADLPLVRAGDLRITAQSGLARNSNAIRLTVPDIGSAVISILPPDIPPTSTPSPTDTPTPESSVLNLTATAVPQGETGPQPRSVYFRDLFLSLLGLCGIGGVIFLLGLHKHDLNYALLISLPAFIVGLVGYNYYALLLPGAGYWRNLFGSSWGAGMATWVGGLLGAGVATLALYGWERWFGPSSGRRQRR